MNQIRITNKHGIDLPLAVWLLQDGYKSGADKAPPGELISATTIMKPTRQLILQRKVDMTQETMDLGDIISSRMGHAFHDSIERSWTEGDWQTAMRRLHYPNDVIARIKINPEPGDLKDDDIPVYLERRGFKPFEDVVLTGQLDFLIGKAYRDFKSTSTYAWTSGNKDQDYILQGSLYRWIFPELIKDDVMRIEFIFTDWQKFLARNPKYPQSRIAHREYALMSLKDTEAWVHDKLAEIRKNAKLKQPNMIRCTDKQLWRGEDTFKYYLNPEVALKGGKCTKKFDSHVDAVEYQQSKGGRGSIIKVPGEVRACLYCSAFSVCEQRKEYFNDDESPVD